MASRLVRLALALETALSVETTRIPAGGGSRDLTYGWGFQKSWDAETEAEFASVVALGTIFAAADTAGAVLVDLAYDDLLAGRRYVFLVAAKNFLGETTTAYHRLDKLAAPSPKVQFQNAATTTMVRSDRKSLKLDVALPSLACIDSNMSASALGYVWRAARLDVATGLYGDA